MQELVLGLRKHGGVQHQSFTVQTEHDGLQQSQSLQLASRALMGLLNQRFHHTSGALMVITPNPIFHSLIHSPKFTCWGCCVPKITNKFMQLSSPSATAAAPKINPPRSMMACSIRVLQQERDAAECRGPTAPGRRPAKRKELVLGVRKHGGVSIRAVLCSMSMMACSIRVFSLQ
eukprot:jgi/Chrzof1/13469/UNPLg00554.t1